MKWFSESFEGMERPQGLSVTFAVGRSWWVLRLGRLMIRFYKPAMGFSRVSWE